MTNSQQLFIIDLKVFPSRVTVMTNSVMKSLLQHKIVTPLLPDILLLPGVAEASFETHL